MGEVRGGEALDLIQSMISGHAGVALDDPRRHAAGRPDPAGNLSLMSDVQIPVYVARAQVASAIDLIVQIARFTEDGSRKVTRITEVAGLDDNNQYQTRDLYVSKPGGKTSEGRLIATLVETGQRPSFAREPYEQGVGELIHLTGGVWQVD